MSSGISLPSKGRSVHDAIATAIEAAVSKRMGHSLTVSGKHYLNSMPAEAFASVTEKNKRHRIRHSRRRNRRESMSAEETRLLQRMPENTTAPRLACRCRLMLIEAKSGRQDLNLRPLDPQSSALNQAELRPENANELC